MEGRRGKEVKDLSLRACKNISSEVTTHPEQMQNLGLAALQMTRGDGWRALKKERKDVSVHTSAYTTGCPCVCVCVFLLLTKC